jgi:hypothetical protein
VGLGEDRKVPTEEERGEAAPTKVMIKLTIYMRARRR